MSIVDWIGICIVVAISSAALCWVITYSAMSNSKRQNCVHSFEKALEVNSPGVHKVAYLCRKCGYVKKVEL